MGAWLRLLWSAQRSAQLGVIWRIVGLAMVLLAWRTQEHQSWAVSWRVGAPELHAMTDAMVRGAWGAVIMFFIRLPSGAY